MKEFEAQALVHSIRCLIRNSQFLKAMRDEQVSASLIAEMVAQTKQQVIALSESCKAADLPMSVLAVDRLLILFNQNLSQRLLVKSLEDAADRAVIVVEDELSLRLYFSLEPEEADNYTKPWDKWEKVVKRFEDTVRDIEEMNKCFALGRYTASMFHALHVAEWGAIELGEYIGVTDPKKGWGPTEKKLRELIKSGHSTLPVQLNGKFEFLEQISREIDSMVLAWRHKVDHAANHLAIVPNTEFTPDIARHIIGAVRIFMLRIIEGMP